VIRSVSYLRRAIAAAFAVPFLSAAVFAGSHPSNPSATDTMGPARIPGVQLGNFGLVDGRIYRGEQPKDEDFKALKALGVTTVVDLRLDTRKESKELAEAAGLKYINIPIDDKKQPSDADVATFIKILDTCPDEKVYVHCAGGRHRTGSMIAVYRLVHCGWSIDEAYGEMKAYDFYTRNGHKGFKDYVFEYYKRMTENPSSVPAAFRTETATTPPVDVAAP
jgi:protein tyrosine/serine phosphatase